jgi:hypothetical protein
VTRFCEILPASLFCQRKSHCDTLIGLSLVSSILCHIGSSIGILDAPLIVVNLPFISGLHSLQDFVILFKSFDLRSERVLSAVRSVHDASC